MSKFIAKCRNDESSIQEIFELIKSEESLSLRKKADIKSLVGKRMIDCIYIKKTMAGFLISHPLSENLVEINGLYIKPEFRKMNLSSLLISKATERKKYSYFAATFIEKVAIILEKNGFERTTLGCLKTIELLGFIRQRLAIHRILEVLRHKKTGKLIVLKKT